MKNIFRFGFAALCLCGVAASQAAENKPYFGIEAGLMMPDASGYDDALNIGGFIGMPMVELKPGSSGIAGSIAIEGELTLTVADGDVNIGGASGDWDVWTLGGYGVYRSPSANNLYFKGKLGLVYSNVDATVGPLSGSDSEVDAAIGFGLGIQLGHNSSLEIEYTLLDDVDFLSFAYRF